MSVDDKRITTDAGVSSIARARPRGRRRCPRRLSVALGVCLLGSWAGGNSYAAVRIARGGEASPNGPDPASVGLAFQDVSYGDRRPAWYVPGEPGRPVILVVHGYGNDRSATVKVGPPLHDLGYGLLFVNLGYVSGNRAYGGGQREAQDVQDAVRWAGRAFRAPVVLLGFSAGALASLSAVATGAPVAAVVADSGFASFRDVVAYRAGVTRALTALLPVVYPLVSGGGRVVDLAGQLAGRRFPVPALVIQGDADRTVSPASGRTLARLTGGRLWEVAGVGHAGAFHADPAGFVARVDSLIRSAVGA